jgi:hypothetical protein
MVFSKSNLGYKHVKPADADHAQHHSKETASGETFGHYLLGPNPSASKSTSRSRLKSLEKPFKIYLSQNNLFHNAIPNCITSFISIIVLCGNDNIMWNISHIQYDYMEYFVVYCQSHITLLWIWIMLCENEDVTWSPQYHMLVTITNFA